MKWNVRMYVHAVIIYKEVNEYNPVIIFHFIYSLLFSCITSTCKETLFISSSETSEKYNPFTLSKINQMHMTRFYGIQLNVNNN